MRVAQSLYESGWITYMRTDSTSLSETAMKAAHAAVEDAFGASYAQPRQYANKVKNAQEAHEAIRPAGDSFRGPAQARAALTQDQFLLYDLIWRRTVASQMADARLEATSVRLSTKLSDGRIAGFVANGSVYIFLGWKAALEDVAEEGDGSSSLDKRLPPLAVGQAVQVMELAAKGHTTNPPRRYSQASLVGELEKRGIGRPSTYASIITLLEDRGYALRKGSALVPTFLGIAIVQLLEQHFGALVDYEFTASMEEELDEVSNGREPRLVALRRFYNGGEGFPGLQTLLAGFGDIDAKAVSSYRIGDSDYFVRVGRYGAYVQEGEDGARASIPADVEPDQLTAERAAEIIAAPSTDRELGTHPDTGLPVVVRTGRYGPYVEEVLPEVPVAEGAKPARRKAAAPKPRRASLAMGLTPQTVTLDDALQLLSLPRVVGQQTGTGIEIRTNFGPSGPYVALMTDPRPDYRSLEQPEQVFSLTLEEAENILAQPKVFRRGRAAAKPEVVVGVDPTTQRSIILKEGRFGPYVTDGETNASLGKVDDPSTLSVERASDLLAERRLAGPSVKPARSRAGASRSTGRSTKTAAKRASSTRRTAK
jgi:DNA topoisomerase-1